jgi:phage gp36-like protein
MSILRYASVADMRARFTEAELIQLTDPEGAAVDAARIETKLDDAQAFIDGYMGRVYRLPLSGCAKPAIPGSKPERVAPPQLTRIACDLARFWLRDAAEENSDVYRRYQAAVAELQAIAEGRALLACPWGGSPGEPIAGDAQTGQEVRHQFSPRAITDDALRGY